MQSAPGEITQLLERWSAGDEHALNQLLPIVYQDLRRLAGYYLRSENRARTLQSTAIVHEVYLRMCGQQDPQWVGRTHFFAVAAKMIRRILVDHARMKSANKRGGNADPQPLDEVLTIPAQPHVDVLPLDEALTELAKIDERKSKVVEMRFFGGMSAKEIAEVLGTAEGTVRRDWSIARAWLYRRLQGELAS